MYADDILVLVSHQDLDNRNKEIKETIQSINGQVLDLELTLNMEKTNIICISKKNCNREDSPIDIAMDSITLKSAGCIKFLGVLISKNSRGRSIQIWFIRNV